MTAVKNTCQPLDTLSGSRPRKSNRKWYNDWSALKAFTTGINGGGPGTRTHYVLDNVDLPEVMNMVRSLALGQEGTSPGTPTARPRSVLRACRWRPRRSF